jgi:hypothetical protein
LPSSGSAQAFADLSFCHAEQITRLGKAVATHAATHPCHLTCSRAQNNNHLLSEAVGLFTAGLALRDHPQASAWASLGWHWINHGFLTQISPGGTYIQHSTSYHRLMLQLALWVHWITRADSHTFPNSVFERLSTATSWLLDLLDQHSGSVPNLGPNDGANILPLTVCAPSDYPVLQAASQAFLGESRLPSGPWDELDLWLCLGAYKKPHFRSPQIESDAASLILRSPGQTAWAYLRAEHFISRPGHADQLHLDLWWHGLNIAQDAGTYLYNAHPPWDNSLTHTAVHNTLTIDDQEQMQRAGKFLYLNWAQAKLIKQRHSLNGIRHSLAAQHNGYMRLGVIHQRSVIAHTDSSWSIEDHVKLAHHTSKKLYRLRLHWLIPDWHWEVAEQPDQSCCVRIESPYGQISLVLDFGENPTSALISSLLIVRAGEVLYGRKAASPTWGWASPTYGVKVPALSVSVEVETALPVTLISRWLLPAPPL